MTQNANNVVYSKPKANGAMWSAAEGATLPTDAVAAIDDAFENWGYISEDGVEEAHSLSSETVKDYGKSPVLVIYGGDELTIALTALEYTNPVVQKNLFGDANVTAADGKLGKVVLTDEAKAVKSYIIEHVLSNGQIERDVIPRGIVTAIDTVTFSASGALGYKVTITPLADSSNAKEYKYFAEAATA